MKGNRLFFGPKKKKRCSLAANAARPSPSWLSLFRPENKRKQGERGRRARAHMLAVPAQIASVVLVAVGARATDAARNRRRHPRRRQLNLDRCRGACKPAPTTSAKPTPATTDKPSAGGGRVEQRRQAPRGLRESVGLVAPRGAKQQRVLRQGHVREAVDGPSDGPDQQDGDAPVGGGQAKGARFRVGVAARAAAASCATRSAS